MKVVWILLALLFCQSAGAIESWVHIVGIDLNNPEQNQTRFYKSAQDFEKVCASHDGKADCKLFINSDPSLAPDDAKEYLQDLPHNKGTPSRDAALKAIEKTVREAQAKGTPAIISLQDHGAPDVTSKSCTYLSSTERICADDLKAILAKYPKAHVLVSANSCYSGAFAELGSENVCTLTYGDRLHFSLGGMRGLWDSIAVGRSRKLSDVGSPLFKEYGYSQILGSQQILQQLCAPARKKLGKEALSNLSYQTSVPIFEDDQDCRDPDNTPQKAVGLATEVLKITEKVQDDSCRNLSVPQSICQARTRLQNASAEIKKTLPRLREIAAEQEKMKNQLSPARDRLVGPNGDYAQVKNQFSADEVKELVDSLDLEQTPDWSKITPDHLALAKQTWEDTKSFKQGMSQKKALEQESDNLLLNLKKKGYYDDLVSVQSCFMESSEEIPVSEDDKKSIDIWNGVAKKVTPKKFTEKDYEDARKCEASFTF